MSKKPKESVTPNDIYSKLETIEKLLVFQLLEQGATTKQIESVLKSGSLVPSKITLNFPVKDIQRRLKK